MTTPRSKNLSKQPYAVGYGKPPSRHRFKPGQSGNPKGRPKHLPELADLTARELRRRGLVTIDGKQVSMTMLELFVKKLVSLAAKGNPKSLSFLIEMISKIETKQRKQKVLGRGTTIHGGMTAKEAAEEFVRWTKQAINDDDD